MKSDAWYPRWQSARGGEPTFAEARANEEVAPSAVIYFAPATGRYRPITLFLLVTTLTDYRLLKAPARVTCGRQ